jgi:hypothetical protein
MGGESSEKKSGSVASDETMLLASHDERAFGVDEKR